MTHPDEVIVNPIDVLQRIRPEGAHRPPWKGWVTSATPGRVNPATSARVIATLSSLCVAVDDFASAADFPDTSLDQALADDLRSVGSGPGRLAAALDSPTLSGLANVMRRQARPQPRAGVEDLVKKCRLVVETLSSVSDSTAGLAAAAAISVNFIQEDLEEALRTGILFTNPSIFAERARGLVTYGLTIQREGFTKEGVLLLSLAFAIAGLLPTLAIPAAILSISLAVAERANEQEMLAKRAQKRKGLK